MAHFPLFKFLLVSNKLPTIPSNSIGRKIRILSAPLHDKISSILIRKSSHANYSPSEWQDIKLNLVSEYDNFSYIQYECRNKGESTSQVYSIYDHKLLLDLIDQHLIRTVLDHYMGKNIGGVIFDLILEENTIDAFQWSKDKKYTFRTLLKDNWKN